MPSAVYVTTSGPVFDGRAESALHNGIEAARHKVADEGGKIAAAAFTGAIRVNTGHFVGHMTRTDQSRTYTTPGGSKSYSMVVTTDLANETVATNEIATYGPWLEGTGSRNLTTRFKGYHGMRIAAQGLQLVAGDIASLAMDPYVDEMN